MSGVAKTVGKVFKPIVKSKWLLPVLLGAAVIFTAGAALPAAGGILGALGSVGGAAASAVTSTLGLTAGSTLSTIVGGAVTGALSGGAIGGVSSLVTGGKFLKGVGQGALLGAATGGVTSGLGAAFGGGASSVGGAAADIPSSIDITPGSFGSGVPSSVGVTASPLAGATETGAPITGGRGMLGEFWESQRQNNFGASPTNATGGGAGGNSDIIGSVIKGVGTGMTEQAKADADRKLQMDLLNRRDANYRTSGRGLFGQEALDAMNGGNGVSPRPGFGAPLAPSPGNVATASEPSAPLQPWDYEYVYDKKSGTFTKVPRT